MPRMNDDSKSTQRGSPWLLELYELFAPVRQAYADSGMTEDEINAELDAALRDARAEPWPQLLDQLDLT